MDHSIGARGFVNNTGWHLIKKQKQVNHLFHIITFIFYKIYITKLFPYPELGSILAE